MTDTSSPPAHTLNLNALKVTTLSNRADASGRWCSGAGSEDNSSDRLIEPIGSDWQVTDSISIPLEGGGVGGSQHTSGSIKRQLKPLDRILRWSDLLTGSLLTVPRQPQVHGERERQRERERERE